MKSAYELAMERLEKESPSAKLTETQKQEIAEIDSLYRARIAEKELFLKGEIDKARTSGDPVAVQELKRQLASETRRLNQEAEARKEKIRSGG